ncbi:MAG: hypothetical protein KC481_19350, partial [Acidimicrobiaceae bacterium]|nr:hypothetical protein [Acidimicrobiaceae bacterium]
MATEPSFPFPDVPPATVPVSARRPDLRERLHLRLQRHVRSEAFRPALTVVGFRGNDTDVVRHDVDRPEDAVLELVLPSRYSAVGVLASS